jgi:hypothetical protein
MATRIEIERCGRIALSRILGAARENRFEVAICSANGIYPSEETQPKQLWTYETRELLWAWQGFQTLVDAQARNVLGERSKWKPYDSRCCVPLPAPIAKRARSAILSLPSQR